MVSAAVYLYIDSVSVDVKVEEAIIVTTTSLSFTDAYPGNKITENIVVNNKADAWLKIGLDFVETSNEALFSLDNRLGTCDNYPNPGWREECEKRIVLDGMLLSELSTISWDANVIQGYAPHVDLILSNGNSLTFEYDKVADCGVGDYPLGELNTFKDKGIVDNTAYAWESIPGPCIGDGSADFLAQHKTLADWKSTYTGVTIDRIEIEVDNWIPGMDAPNSKVWNIAINGEEIKVKYTYEPTTADIAPGPGTTNVLVTFTIDGSSPVGEFTGNLNIARV